MPEDRAVSRAGGEGPARPASEVLDFLRLIWAVDHGLQRLSTRMEARLGVTGPERLVIRTVGRFPGIPAGRLANLLQVNPGTLTAVVRRLERQGYLRRRSDARDGRRVLLGLTAKGRRFEVETEGTVEFAVGRALADIPAPRLRSTREVLESIANTLTDRPVPGGGADGRRTGRRTDRRS